MRAAAEGGAAVTCSESANVTGSLRGACGRGASDGKAIAFH